MKALVLTDYMTFHYMDVPDPEVGPDEVLVNVKAAGICGSDVQGMDGSTGRRIPPVIMGHEASGIIVEQGEKVKKWKVGDRVTFDSTIYRQDDWYTRRGLYNLSNGREVLGVSAKEFKRDGAFAEYIAIPQHILYRIPENVSLTQAAMTEPAAVALHAIQLTPVSLHDTAMVIGTGMIGSFIIQGLKIYGCREIIAVDLEDDRLNMAKELGATVALNPRDHGVSEKVKELTGNRGVDVAFEAAGNPDTFQIGIESLRKGGTLTLIGNLVPSVNMPLQRVVTHQLRLQGSYAIAGEFPKALEMIASGKIIVDALLSAEAPLCEGAEWFQRLYKREEGLFKVVLIPGR
jgi:L-iditol 2-dehydrogenase